MTLSDPSTSKYRLPSLVRAYDILAVRPVTAAAFQNACLTLDVALISLDLTNHFPFHFRPKPCMAAVARGVRFEISYAQVLAADQRGRANFIGNATELIRATRGRGIVISSEATGALTLRAPADVINLLSVWGLHSEKGMEGLRSVPRSVVVNEGIKRTGYRGVINVVQPAADSNKRSEEKQTDEKGAKKAKNPKRKNLGEEDGQAPSGNNSKRQAKKAKLASRAAGDTNK
jgi:ribonuclease P/MRP protein subunit RPP1